MQYSKILIYHLNKSSEKYILDHAINREYYSALRD